MTVVAPGLTVRDSQILELLRGGASPSRVVQVGAYRRTWAPADVARVAQQHGRLVKTLAETPTPRRRKPPRGSTPWDPPEPAGQPAAVDLSPREADVLTCLCRGLSNPAIAAELRIAEDTVKTHVKQVLRHLGARDRTHAVALALNGGATVTVRPPHKRNPA